MVLSSFQLEAPDAGGATVFPELKLSLFPTKNDCVFWSALTISLIRRPVLAGLRVPGSKEAPFEGLRFALPFL